MAAQSCILLQQTTDLKMAFLEEIRENHFLLEYGKNKYNTTKQLTILVILSRARDMAHYSIYIETERHDNSLNDFHFWKSLQNYCSHLWQIGGTIKSYHIKTLLLQISNQCSA